MKGFSELIVVLLAAGMQNADAADSPGQTFARKAAVDSMAEVELADVARQQAVQESVRQYAQRLYQDHKKANQTLRAVAQQKGISLPTDIDAKHKRERDKLGEKQGADFDADYLAAMIEEHKKGIKAFEKEAKDGKDPELKAYAAQWLPALREHLQQAERLHASGKKAAKQPKSST